MRLRRLRHLTSACATAVVLAASVAPAAIAQEEGVTLDPGDPAAKEYSLPHDEARREATGEATGPVTQGGSNAAPFGEGVTPDAGGSSSSGSSEKRSGDIEGRSRAEGNGDSPASTTGAATDSGSPSGGAAQTQAGGMGSTGALIVGGGLALLVAGLGGLALRAIRGPADA